MRVPALKPSARWFADGEDEQVAPALTRLAAGLRAGDVVLVKASRGMRLERIVQALRQALERREA